MVPSGLLLAQEVSTRRLQTRDGELELFLNSQTLSQAIAINKGGSILGTREIPDQAGGQLIPVPFYSGKYGTKDIPTPSTFSNIEPIGICDSEMVIAYATRPAGNKDGSLAGVLWDPQRNAITLLPKAPGDVVNQPQAITPDGHRITGYTTGPGRLRPALWELQSGTQEWKITVLPTEYDNNPYLMSGSLIISPNGKWIAGCCTEAFASDGSVDSALYLWTEKSPGVWDRQLLSRDQLYLRGINDSGQMAGSVRGKTGERQPCYVSPKGDFRLLPLLDNDVSGEAKGISNAGVIVGFSDDPPGGQGGPEPCYWTKDFQVVKLAPSGSWFGMLQAINENGQMAGLVEDPASGASLAFRTVPAKK
jgi:hypothetical protein